MSELMIWPTKEQDMAAAMEISNRYNELNDGQPLSLFEIQVSDSREPLVQISDWIKELAVHYREQYGLEEGQFVTRLVLQQILRGQHTLH